ncbi:MAG: hypothetical protein GYB68_19395 [Chloroflexi bacterium]|nr:hypothetical protein [Chloroflexota bacterium]
MANSDSSKEKQAFDPGDSPGHIAERAADQLKQRPGVESAVADGRGRRMMVVYDRKTATLEASIARIDEVQTP